MNKALYGILGFILGILVFTSMNNGNLFTDASESSDGLIEQLDTILASPRFDNREYSVSIMEKTEVLAEIFEENTIPYLAMKYINVSLKVKIDSMPVTTTTVVEELPSDFENSGDEETHESADEEILDEEIEEETEETEVSSSNEYNAAIGFPLTQKEKESAPVSDGEAADLEGFNVGRQAIPTKVANTEDKTVSDPETYKYQVDGDLYNYTCAQKRCVEACLNLDAGYAESLCKKECISDACMSVKNKGKLDMREVK